MLLLLIALLPALPGLAQTSQLPRLYIALAGKSGDVAGSSNPVPVPSNERLSLRVCLEVRTVADAFEQLEVRALNQHPDYFKNRAGPNVTLSVRQITGTSAVEVPFRLYSSGGGGKDPTVSYVSADIDILEDKAIRQNKLQQFAEWFLAEADPRVASPLLEHPQGLQAVMEYFDEGYVSNPQGDYEITARYSPTTQTYWRGTLVSAPFRIRVIQAGDFFDQLKKKLRTGVRNPL